MFTFIAGIIIIIFSFLMGACPVSGGAKFTPSHRAIWFDPKIFVQELESGQGWWIGAGLEPTSWERVNARRWSSQVQLHDRAGLAVANARHTMKWCTWEELPREPAADYLRTWRADLATVKGENAFIMTPYLREWQRRHIWPDVPERARLLDIGVGTGRSRDLWFAKKLQVWGVEPNLESVASLRAKKLPPVVALEGWSGADPRIQTWLAAGSIDVVMMSYSITFFFESPRHLNQLVANITHALRPGGRFVLIGMDGERVEQWFDAAGSDRLDNALFTITKPKKFPKRTFGREIEITMKNPNTLVEAQREYLVNFDHFRKVLAKAGLTCSEDRRVTAPAYLGEWPRRFVEAQRYLRFDKK